MKSRNIRKVLPPLNKGEFFTESRKSCKRVGKFWTYNEAGMVVSLFYNIDNCMQSWVSPAFERELLKITERA